MASMPKWTGTGKFLGYVFIIENPKGRNEHSKIYKSLNGVRKAAMPYSYTPTSVFKCYDSFQTFKDPFSSHTSTYQKEEFAGVVTKKTRGQNEWYIWQIIDPKTLKKGNKYVLKKDGSLGSRVTGELTVSKYGQILKYPKGRY